MDERRFLESPMRLEQFDLDGLKARCQVDGCEGVVLIRRDPQSFHLDPQNIYCTLCGQHYDIETRGLVGWPLEEMLRRESQIEPCSSDESRIQQGS